MPALAVVATFKVRRSGRDQVEGQMDGLKMRIVFLNGFSWNVFFGMPSLFLDCFFSLMFGLLKNPLELAMLVGLW